MGHPVTLNIMMMMLMMMVVVVVMEYIGYDIIFITLFIFFPKCIMSLHVRASA